MRSPLIIEIICVLKTGHLADFLNVHAQTGEVRDAMEWLFKNELVEHSDDGMRLTPRGERWLKAMVELPLPVEQTIWVMP